jgi:hypothetical protein
MFAIEFQTQIKNGIIEVPTEYQNRINGSVRVIVLAPERAQRTGIIAHLLEHPIQDDSFIPLTREEIYQDRG